MARGHGLGDVDEPATRTSGLGAKQLEHLSLLDPMTLRQDALGTLGQRAAAERPFEVVAFREAPRDDVDRALEVLGVAGGDLGEDPALRRLVDEFGLARLELSRSRAGFLDGA